MNQNTEKIDRQSAMPIYQQIATDITHRIENNEWTADSTLPSENELTREYNASRVTIRQALAKLKTDGLIEKRRGVGTFVKPNSTKNILTLSLPSIGIPNKGISSSDIQIELTDNANPNIYEKLDLPVGTTLAYIYRVLEFNNTPIGVNQTWIPASYVPDIEQIGLVDNRLSQTLIERYNIRYTSVNNSIEATLQNAQLCQIFCTTIPAPALKVDSLYTMEDNIPVQFSSTIWNGYSSQFNAMITSQ